jgi:hypothetical protein
MADEKLKAVNKILDIMGTRTVVSRENGGWYCTWQNWKDKTVKKRYSARDGWPVWGDQWGHGGTCQSALTQLMRWLQGKTVHPLRVWRHWVGLNVQLGTPEIIEILLTAGYPENPPCVLCGKPLMGSHDWFNTESGEGPGHWHRKCDEYGVAE